MRELHVVALSEDGRSVLLAPSKKAPVGAFRVKLDGKLSAALRGELPREGESGPRAVEVSPKEIQARMRAGESAQQIADAAGVPVARVERFAGPVLSERERIIDQARAGYLTRGRLGPSQLPLGDAVQAALAETDSLKTESVQWSTRRLESGHWLVQVSYVARARAKTASWVFDAVTRALTASDPASSALGHRSDVPATGAAAAVAAVAAAAHRAASGSAGARRTTRTAKRAVVAKPAKKVLAAKPAKKVSPAKKAPVKKAPVKKVVTAKKARPPRTMSPPALRVVPPPPVPAQEPEPLQQPRKRAAGERATVPAWADVLLGISPRDISPRDKADG